MNQVANVQTSRSPLAAMAERLSIDANELQSVLMKTVMPGNGNVSNEQFVSFVAVANSYRLDPLKREIFAFPAKGGGIQPVVSIDGWLSIINSHPEFDGMTLQENYDNDEFVSVTCSMYRKDREHPVVITEFLDECIRNTEPWKKKKRMLRHKATIQCARYAFGLGGIVEQDEAEAALEEREVSPTAARAEPQPYPDADFEANLPKWREVIEGGRKSPEQIINMVSTKGTLTEAQKQQICDLAPIEVDATTGEVMQ